MKLRPSLFRLAWIALFLVLAVPVSASETIEASAVKNPPPVEAFTDFDRYEVAQITMASQYQGSAPNAQALRDLQADLDSRIQPWASARNTQPAKKDPPRVLLVEPRIEKIRFISTSARVWGGAFSGTSRVLVKVRITDKATGALIAEPEFYQRAGGMAGAWSFGAADKAMLERVASLVADYLGGNVDQAVGGPTGKEN